VPYDPVAFARVLLAEAFGPENLDPRHQDHTGWLTRMCAYLTTLTPEHWERIGATAHGLGVPAPRPTRSPPSTW